MGKKTNSDSEDASGHTKGYGELVNIFPMLVKARLQLELVDCFFCDWQLNNY